ncbi:hypothetical protein CBS101457_005716 [Exobasidium rhododendri]|nr:hypothetical protein CBS101457_005716 [Exobasidium rhododendri]
METISGDKFIEDCARYIRFNEAKLGQASSSASAATWINPTAWLRTTSPPINQSNSSRAPRPPLSRPTPLRLTSHHLYYLLIRFEALAITTGPLDVRIASTSRPSSSFAYISSNAAGSGYRKDRDDSMSISSLQTTMSAFGLGAASQNTGWWSVRNPDVTAELKYIFSAMTKIPAIKIGPPPLKLIEAFEDCPGELSIPLDVFKNAQFLEFEDTDPRSFIGWDRLSIQLRSLSIKRSGVEDITDILVDAVIMDGRRRRGERVRHRVRKVHASYIPEDAQTMEAAPTDAAGSTPTNNNDSSSEPPTAQLPSLSWHFLRHLSLSDNSLTFLPSSCLSCLTSLTSLDLSNNLLIAVPPSLHLVPTLQSLNLTNNLIDSVMGIPDALPGIKALNLSQNRLESLCGLERLPTLMRIDLRKNGIFEAGEVGRLATLPMVYEVFIAGNPLLEELDDARVEVFIEFAKEGNNLESLKLDDEGVGYFERQRIRERIPNLDRLANKSRDETPSADVVLTNSKGAVPPKAPTAAALAKAPTEGQSVEPVVKTVHHRNTTNKIVKATAQRRNRRIVELPEDANNEAGPSNQNNHTREQTEVSDSDIIKRAALAGDNEAALEVVTKKKQPAEQTSMPAAKAKEDQPVSTKKAGAAPASASRGPGASSTSSSPITRPSQGTPDTPSHDKSGSQGEEGASNTASDSKQKGPSSKSPSTPGPRAQIGRQKTNLSRKGKAAGGNNVSEPSNSTIATDLSHQQQLQSLLQTGDTDLRKKIEALKGEVGDDWLRLLARGESVYIPKKEDEEDGAEH